LRTVSDSTGTSIISFGMADSLQLSGASGC